MEKQFVVEVSNGGGWTVNDVPPAAFCTAPQADAHVRSVMHHPRVTRVDLTVTHGAHTFHTTWVMDSTGWNRYTATICAEAMAWVLAHADALTAW